MTRRYDNSRRKQSASGTAARIISATVVLHAECGALGTTHAAIARAAGVSVATVYKHFSSRDALIPYCTGFVAERAPRVDVATILAPPGRDLRIARLASAVCALHAYLHPWMRWAARDASALPALSQYVTGAQRGLQAHIGEVLDALAPPCVAGDERALALVLLDYASWSGLLTQLGQPEAVAVALGQGLRRILSTTPIVKGTS